MATQIFYHGSHNADLTETEASIFGGFFFSLNYMTAESFGDYVYSVEIDEEKIMTKSVIYNLVYDYDRGAEIQHRALEFIENNIGYYIYRLVDEFGLDYEDAVDKIYDCIIDEREIEEIRGLAGDELADWDWDMQKYRGEFAFSFGYDAVEMTDETGTSVLIREGIKIKRA